VGAVLRHATSGEADAIVSLFVWERAELPPSSSPLFLFLF
jgi:hypothetical protein